MEGRGEPVSRESSRRSGSIHSVHETPTKVNYEMNQNRSPNFRSRKKTPSWYRSLPFFMWHEWRTGSSEGNNRKIHESRGTSCSIKRGSEDVQSDGRCTVQLKSVLMYESITHQFVVVTIVRWKYYYLRCDSNTRIIFFHRYSSQPSLRSPRV